MDVLIGIALGAGLQRAGSVSHGRCMCMWYQCVPLYMLASTLLFPLRRAARPRAATQAEWTISLRISHSCVLSSSSTWPRLSEPSRMAVRAIPQLCQSYPPSSDVLTVDCHTCISLCCFFKACTRIGTRQSVRAGKVLEASHEGWNSPRGIVSPQKMHKPTTMRKTALWLEPHPMLLATLTPHQNVLYIMEIVCHTVSDLVGCS